MGQTVGNILLSLLIDRIQKRANLGSLSTVEYSLNQFFSKISLNSVN